MLTLFQSFRRKSAPRPEPPSLVVVGLGNPGPEYAGTRHNAGFWCIDLLSKRHDITMERRHRSAIIERARLETSGWFSSSLAHSSIAAARR